MKRDKIYIIETTNMMPILALIEELNSRGIKASIAREVDKIILKVPKNMKKRVIDIIKIDFPEVGAYIKE